MSDSESYSLCIELYLPRSQCLGGIFDIQPRVASFTHETMTQFLSVLRHEFYPRVLEGNVQVIPDILDRIQNLFGEEACVRLDLNLESYGLDAVQEWLQQPAVPHLSVLVSSEGADHWEKHVIDENIHDVFYRTGLLQGEAPAPVG